MFKNALELFNHDNILDHLCPKIYVHIISTMKSTHVNLAPSALKHLFLIRIPISTHNAVYQLTLSSTSVRYLH